MSTIAKQHPEIDKGEPGKRKLHKRVRGNSRRGPLPLPVRRMFLRAAIGLEALVFPMPTGMNNACTHTRYYALGPKLHTHVCTAYLQPMGRELLL